VGGQGARVLKERRPRHPQGSLVPFHRQSFDFTCGPACLLMAMRHFDPSLEATRDLEVDLWREANLVEAYASSRQGLALAAHRRGFRVRTQGNAETVELLDCLRLDLDTSNRDVAVALHEDVRRRCRAAGIPDTVAPVTLKAIRGWLTQGWVPLVLVDARLVGDEAVPHWVVVTDVEGGRVVFHDPLASRGGAAGRMEEFERRLGFRGVSCAVVVRGRRAARAGHGSGRRGLAPSKGDRPTPGALLRKDRPHGGSGPGRRHRRSESEMGRLQKAGAWSTAV